MKRDSYRYISTLPHKRRNLGLLADIQHLEKTVVMIASKQFSE